MKIYITTSAIRRNPAKTKIGDTRISRSSLYTYGYLMSGGAYVVRRGRHYRKEWQFTREATPQEISADKATRKAKRDQKHEAKKPQA